MLAPLAVLAARRPRLAWLGVAGGLWSFAALGLGVAPGGPWLPEALVSPRHTLARPPTHQTWPLDEAMASLAPLPKSILVLSEDETLYEGFVVLSARERWMWADVRGAVLDPQGTTELFGDIDRIVWVGPPGAAWPSREGVERELSDDHYDLTTTPPVAERLSEAAGAFVEIGRWRTGDRDVVSYRRVAVPVPEPEPEPEPEPG